MGGKAVEVGPAILGVGPAILGEVGVELGLAIRRNCPGGARPWSVLTRGGSTRGGSSGPSAAKGNARKHKSPVRFQLRHMVLSVEHHY